MYFSSQNSKQYHVNEYKNTYFTKIQQILTLVSYACENQEILGYIHIFWSMHMSYDKLKLHDCRLIFQHSIWNVVLKYMK